MSILTIPAGKTLMTPQAFSGEQIEHILEELCAPDHAFTGYIKVVSGENLYILLFFNSQPYAAAKIANHNLVTISLAEYFSTTGLLENSKALLSIHETDPVLLKSILIITQTPPTIKAPANQLNLKSILNQIRRESADALIVLQKLHEINFFFFKNNTAGASYYSDSKFPAKTNTPVDEQMLSYAMQPGTQISASIYRNIATTADSDYTVMSHVEILRLMSEKNKPEEGDENLVLKILNGPMKGEILTGRIPSVMGRKDTDIVINDSLVSKRHTVIQHVDGSLLLIDLNSTNGTFVNGSRIKQQKIVAGDVIMLGETTISVEKLPALS